MLWPVLLAVPLGLMAAGLLLLWIDNRSLRHKLRLAGIEVVELESKLEQLREFNQYCITHAAEVLAAWEDFKQGGGN